MIDNFLRPPRGLSEVVADTLRGLGALSVILAAVFFELTDAGVIAFTLPGLVAPRFIGIKPWPDIMLSVTLLVAAWSSVLDLYTRITWWDLVVHFFCVGVLAVGCYLFLARLRIVPTPFTSGFTSPGGVILTTTFGLALGSLWEMVEWLGYAYITSDIYVTYEDTISDMATGGLGALGMGFAVAYLPLLHTAHPTSASAPPMSEGKSRLNRQRSTDRDSDPGSSSSMVCRVSPEKDLLD
ncbi:hypothetical protein [Corynebacterium halotolerans]|uniref:Uncharacterized protein n=1 Tax=Corynebacterium halotolerans YIM 70093 = DSM 44683 TaxID=1121362 RepID=M1NRB0_9CORY|nr:hypothetical protein [Corynebacterium halotolerans]AGF72037.1 hypothetical protein A605_05155 [Corynebacterium halotolerans YIM 70093 = DSM 44683]